MVERPYTVAPASETERAVRDLVHRLSDEIVAELHPSALLLSGSFARGEGGAYLAGGALHTTSDLDLMAVFHGPLSLWRTLGARRRAGRVTRTLRRTFPGAQIDLTIRPAILLLWPPATLDFYDLLRSARVLYGAVPLPPPAAVRLADIPPEELRRRLVKRGVGLLESWVRLTAGVELNEVAARATETDLDKAVLVSGDVWLHRCSRYDHRLLRRMEHLTSLEMFSGPTRLLQSEYLGAAGRRLLPQPGTQRDTAQLQQRWRGAATEWLAAHELVEEWSRFASAPRALRALGHPSRAARHVVAVARQMVRGLPTPARQQAALPHLIRLALGDHGHAWLHTVTAQLLRVPSAEAFDLSNLIRRFLLAWNRGLPSRTRVVEPAPTERTRYRLSAGPLVVR